VVADRLGHVPYTDEVICPAAHHLGLPVHMYMQFMYMYNTYV
jgi:hypothetical protein